jgi:hypothetical protein
MEQLVALRSNLAPDDRRQERILPFCAQICSTERRARTLLAAESWLAPNGTSARVVLDAHNGTYGAVSPGQLCPQIMVPPALRRSKRSDPVDREHREPGFRLGVGARRARRF